MLLVPGSTLPEIYKYFIATFHALRCAYFPQSASVTLPNNALHKYMLIPSHLNCILVFFLFLLFSLNSYFILICLHNVHCSLINSPTLYRTSCCLTLRIVHLVQPGGPPCHFPHIRSHYQGFVVCHKAKAEVMARGWPAGGTGGGGHVERVGWGGRGLMSLQTGAVTGGPGVPTRRWRSRTRCHSMSPGTEASTRSSQIHGA